MFFLHSFLLLFTWAHVQFSDNRADRQGEKRKAEKIGEKIRIKSKIEKQNSVLYFYYYYYFQISWAKLPKPSMAPVLVSPLDLPWLEITAINNHVIY